jgi:hypothetical protein
MLTWTPPPPVIIPSSSLALSPPPPPRSLRISILTPKNTKKKQYEKQYEKMKNEKLLGRTKRAEKYTREDKLKRSILE